MLPVPLFNVINGGAHADNGIDIQEFLLAADRRVDLLRGPALGRRDLPRAEEPAEVEGPVAPASATRAASPPTSSSNREALDFLVKAIEKAGFTPGTDIALGLDVAATEFFENGVYRFEGKDRTRRGAHRVLRRARRRVPDHHDRGRARRGRLGRLEAPHREARHEDPARRRRPVRHQPEAPRRRHRQARRANSLLVKVNQIGTLTETLDAVTLAQRAGYTTMFSHRSGETEDTTIADLAVATNCGSDQDRRARPQRARREVQSASAHRGRAGRRGGVRRPHGVPALHGVIA